MGINIFDILVIVYILYEMKVFGTIFLVINILMLLGAVYIFPRPRLRGEEISRWCIAPFIFGSAFIIYKLWF